MFPASLFLWWYTAGWRDQAELLKTRLSRVSDRFSIDLLLRTFFSPFRQISADAGGPSFDAKMRAWADRMISRCIGAMIRSALILTGVFMLVGVVVLGLMRLVFWPVLPLLPLIGLVLTLSGWVPWQI